MSTPARRAESILATTWGIRPQFLLPGGLEVPDLDRDPRLAADGDRLVERLQIRSPSERMWVA